jgi:hypothetical protein
MISSKIVFQTNVPVELALRFTAGKPTESKFGNGTQYMYSATDGRVFFVSEAAGKTIDEQLKTLEVQPGDIITITKAEVDTGRGKKAVRWQVAQVGDAIEPAPVAVPKKAPVSIAPEPAMGERPDGTYAVPVLAPAPAPVVTYDQTPEWAKLLLTQTNILTDIYAQAVKHASQYQGAVKHETVQSILISAFINITKNSTLGGAR